LTRLNVSYLFCLKETDRQRERERREEEESGEDEAEGRLGWIVIQCFCQKDRETERDIFVPYNIHHIWYDKYTCGQGKRSRELYFACIAFVLPRVVSCCGFSAVEQDLRNQEDGDAESWDEQKGSEDYEEESHGDESQGRAH